MSLEIREVIICAKIGESTQNSSGNGKKPGSSASGVMPDEQMMEKIVQATVEQVLEILKIKNER